jgi:hypothetical protein
MRPRAHWRQRYRWHTQLRTPCYPMATDSSDTHVVQGKLTASRFLLQEEACRGRAARYSTFDLQRCPPLSFPEPVFVNLFEGAQESVPTLAGRIDSSESIPGLLKRFQIRALLEGQHYRQLTDQSPNSEFVNISRSPKIDSQPGGPVRQPGPPGYKGWWNRFLRSLNVYKYGLRRLRVRVQ